MNKVNCSSFCANECPRRHHPVLLTLIDANSPQTLEKFKQTLRAYQITGFQLQYNVPDPNPDFRHPIFFWAAVLGKVGAVKALLRPPFNADVLMKSDDDETALHRLLFLWKDYTRLHILLELIEVFIDCIEVADSHERTPLHVCANLLSNGTKKEIDFWKPIIKKMIRETENREQGRCILNRKDKEGNTILHMLSKREELLDIIEYVVYRGAEINVANESGETPLDLSWRYALSIYNFLHMMQSVRKDWNELDSVEKRTRASINLSETKDYTEFFEEEDNIHSDHSEEEFECKRKVNDKNGYLIEKLKSLSTSSPKPCIGNKRKIKRKQRIILSDEDSMDSFSQNCCKSDIQDVSVPLKPEVESNSSLFDPKQNEVNKNSKWRYEELQQLNVELEEHQNKTKEQLQKEIKEVMENIRALYSSLSSDEGTEHLILGKKIACTELFPVLRGFCLLNLV